METLTLASEGIRILSHSVRKRLFGRKRYSGNAKEVCLQIVKECWNGQYFQASTGHFCQFYSRDFGISSRALVKLGYNEEVIRTLDYALGRFRRFNKITVALTPSGKPFDFPGYGIDSLAFMLIALKNVNNKTIAAKYGSMLVAEAEKIKRKHVDLDTGLTRRDMHFSSMKDHAIRKGSCYDNIMLAVISRELKALRLEDPLKDYNYAKIIKDKFWTGYYFLDDLSGSRHIAGDANIVPFWTEIFDSKEMLKRSISAIKAEGLHIPFPLKYTSKSVNQKMIGYEFLVKGWEKDSIWTNIGMIYLELLSKVDKETARSHLQKYEALIENHGTVIEVFTSNGQPYSSPFYMADSGMLWASLFIGLSGR